MQKLALEKPNICRLHLGQYLPYLDALVARSEFAYRNGEGAYPHAAIRREYGPLKGSSQDQRELEKLDKEVRSQHALRQQARINHA